MPTLSLSQNGFATYQIYSLVSEREGHARVRFKHIEGEHNLGMWTNAQRSADNAKKLSAERITALNALGFMGAVSLEEAYQEGLDTLRQFVKRGGHARVT